MKALSTTHHAASFSTSLRAAFAAFALLLVTACGGGADDTRQVAAISTQPADASVVEGNAASFSVAAVGSAPLAYQWQSSVDGGVTFVPVPGATSASYAIASTVLGQNGLRVRVVVGNDQGSVTSSTVTLTVTAALVAPLITVQPADAAVTAPATASFHVTATGTSPAYAWQSSSDGVTWSAVAGAADAPSLDVTGTTTTMSGLRYRVVVSNAAGSVTSNAALLTVAATPAAPAFLLQPASQSILAGLGVDFVVVVAGTPVPSIQWRLDGANLVDGVLAGGACAGASVSGATTATLSLSSVPLACSNATFTAIASNGIAPDATSFGAILTVGAAPAAPAITLQPTDAVAPAGATATFSALASGVPTPSAQWQQSSDAGMTWANIVGATAPTYTTPPVAPADSGRRYRVIFTNASSSATSGVATLTVGAAPVVTMQPANVSVGLAAVAVFNAAATGAPAPMVQWQQSSDGGATWVDIGGGVATSYSTAPTTLADDGLRFRAVFSNAVATVPSNAARLTVGAAPTGGPLTLLAGNVGSGAGWQDGPPARFSSPEGAAVDAAGNVYVADTANHVIRKITPAGVTTTLAGMPGMQGSNDGTGTAARFYAPYGVTVDPGGDLWVADTYNHTVRRVTPAGEVTTFAGTAGQFGSVDGSGAAARFNFPWRLALDGTGNLYVADRLNHTIRKITPAGAVSTLAGSPGHIGSADGTGAAARFSRPSGLALDPAGNLYVADTFNYAIRKITPAGVVSTLAGKAGVLGSADGTGVNARFNALEGLAIDGANNLYAADPQNQTVRRITLAAVVTTLAGSAGSAGSDDGSGAAARFKYPSGIAATAAGSVYVTEEGNHTVRAITPAGVVSTVAGSAFVTGSADGVGAAARFWSPLGATIDAAGTVYVADSNNRTIRAITPAGVTTTLAGAAGTAPANTDGIGSAARFFFPKGLAVDSTGNVYVSDYQAHVIRKITPAGVVSTLAGTAGLGGSADGPGTTAKFLNPMGLAVDAAGNVYVADSGNATIRMITPAGMVSTLAGTAGVTGSADGSGAAAQFRDPRGVAADAAGNVYVADTANQTIRLVTPGGLVTTLAGSATVTGSVDGSGSAARFLNPEAIAVDPAGILYLADTYNHTLRRVTAAGVVSTFVGKAGERGVRLGPDGRLDTPFAVAVNATTGVTLSLNGVLTMTLP
jgi:sugar lactone lactonase YvrE